MGKESYSTIWLIVGLLLLLYAGFNYYRSFHKASSNEIERKWEEALLENAEGADVRKAHMLLETLQEPMSQYAVDRIAQITRMARGEKDVEEVRIFGPKISPGGAGQTRFNGDTVEHPKVAIEVSCGECHTPAGTLNAQGSAEKAASIDTMARIDAGLVEVKRDAKTNSLSFGSDPRVEVVAHLYNREDPCWKCHKPAQKVCGVVQMDFSLKDLARRVAGMESTSKSR